MTRRVRTTTATAAIAILSVAGTATAQAVQDGTSNTIMIAERIVVLPAPADPASGLPTGKHVHGPLRAVPPAVNS
jgi:hypothetical protein